VSIGYGSNVFSFGLGGFARYYFGDPTAKTLFFGETSMGFGQLKNPSYGSSSFGFTFAVSPGVSFRAGENVLINLSLPYRGSTSNGFYSSIDGTLGMSYLLLAK
jgi:hypothetical protein